MNQTEADAPFQRLLLAIRRALPAAQYLLILQIDRVVH